LKTNIHLWPYLSQFFVEWEMFQAKLVENIEKHILSFINFFLRKSYRLWDNVGKCGRARQDTGDNKIRCMRNPYQIPKAANTHSEYVICIRIHLTSVHSFFFYILYNTYSVSTANGGYTSVPQRHVTLTLRVVLWTQFLPPTMTYTKTFRATCPWSKYF